MVAGRLAPGSVVWCDLEPVIGREQGGRRPAVIISSEDFCEVIDSLTVVVPCSSRDRDWLNHVRLSGETGLDSPTFAITEQPRTVSTGRIHRVVGRVDDECLSAITRWVSVWLHRAA